MTRESMPTIEGYDSVTNNRSRNYKPVVKKKMPAQAHRSMYLLPSSRINRQKSRSALVKKETQRRIHDTPERNTPERSNKSITDAVSTNTVDKSTFTDQISLRDRDHKGPNWGFRCQWYINKKKTKTGSEVYIDKASLEACRWYLPALYSRDISTGDYEETLQIEINHTRDLECHWYMQEESIELEEAEVCYQLKNGETFSDRMNHKSRNGSRQVYLDHWPITTCSWSHTDEKSAEYDELSFVLTADTENQEALIDDKLTVVESQAHFKIKDSEACFQRIKNFLMRRGVAEIHLNQSISNCSSCYLPNPKI